jgi:Flp pilus assembly pilin Flp
MLAQLLRFFRGLIRGERPQNSVAYALLVAFVALGVAAVTSTVSSDLRTILLNFQSYLEKTKVPVKEDPQARQGRRGGENGNPHPDNHGGHPSTQQ